MIQATSIHQQEYMGIVMYTSTMIRPSSLYLHCSSCYTRWDMDGLLVEVGMEKDVLWVYMRYFISTV